MKLQSISFKGTILHILCDAEREASSRTLMKHAMTKQVETCALSRMVEISSGSSITAQTGQVESGGYLLNDNVMRAT